jgi:hypothetical protein
MTDPTTLMMAATTGLAALGMASLAALKGWHSWLELKRLEIAARANGEGPVASPTNRIELADLKERVRKLEGIAAGVDL